MVGHHINAIAIPLVVGVDAPGDGTHVHQSLEPEDHEQDPLTMSKTPLGLLQPSGRTAEVVFASSKTDVGSTTWVTWRHIFAHHLT